MISRYVSFEAPFTVRVAEEEVKLPSAGEVLVQAQSSAISAGTEMLVYRGQLPDEISLDETLTGMEDPVAYPLKYGYALTGEVVDIGKGVGGEWLNKFVFMFHPHQQSFCTSVESLITLPKLAHRDDALFLANMETAVSFLMDGRPMIGERVLVIGLGIVGQLTTSLLKRHKDLDIHAIDLSMERQRMAQQFCGTTTSGPQELLNKLVSTQNQFDLVYELSGHPEGLNVAIEAVKESGRIVIGSWYGKKNSAINLGGRFHRSKVSMYASQVSKLDPVHLGCWTKERRLDLAKSLLDELNPSSLITHRFPLRKAAEAYAILDKQPENVMQAVLTYG